MRSYKLYAAIVAIACIALQEANCEKNQIEDEDEYFDAVDFQEQDCGEYKSKIWDNAFSSPSTMQLAKVMLETAENMGTDSVCSDTIRTAVNYAHVISTNENAHYVVGMFLKLIKTMAKQATLNESNQLGETRKLLLRVVDSPEIRNLITKSITRSAEILQEPVNRVRLAKMVRAAQTMLKPSENEKRVKETVNKLKGAITSPFQATRGAMKKIGLF